mmetsp:Transcript_2896/g.6217  ORF Transcript_2896/g.6217 Transcript_2896/m.6217 type:complete len:148 (-) Transcript_2896:102-545(-)
MSGSSYVAFNNDIEVGSPSFYSTSAAISLGDDNTKDNVDERRNRNMGYPQSCNAITRSIVKMKRSGYYNLLVLVSFLLMLVENLFIFSQFLTVGISPSHFFFIIIWPPNMMQWAIITKIVIMELCHLVQLWYFWLPYFLQSCSPDQK